MEKMEENNRLENNEDCAANEELNAETTFESNGKKYGGTSFNDNGSVKMPEGEALCRVDYDVKLCEEEKAFRLFQKLYVRKSNIIKTVVLGIVLVVFGFQFVTDVNDYLSLAAVIIAAVAVFITWYNPVIIRKSLMKALAPLEKDKYIFKLFDDAFTIETEISDEEFEEGEERIAPPPRVVWFEKSDFEVKELDDMFVLIMKNKFKQKRVIKLV